MTQYFRTIFVTIMPFVTTLFFAYLIGSFLSVSFNPAEWTIDMRMLMSEFGVAFGGALLLKLRSERLV